MANQRKSSRKANDGDKDALSKTERLLLSELFHAQQKDPGGVNSLRFRAKRSEHLETIDRMVSIGLIDRQDRDYLIPLVGIAELSKTDQNADSLLYLCGYIFDALKPLYIEDPEKKYLVSELANIVDVPIGRVRRALSYLRQGSVFSGYSTDLQASDAYVIISEEVIRRGTFREIIDQQYKWLTNKKDSLPNQVQQESKKRSSRKKPQSFRTPLETYTAERQIGQGGSGIVVEAIDENGKSVAIKYIDPKRVSGSRNTRFRNEIRFGQHVRHQNLVPVLDVGETIVDDQQTLFFVMPLYSMTLRDAQKRGLPPEEAVRIFEQILNGLEAAHSVRVWHRDLKPENILLSENIEDVCIGDFGIAHFESEELYVAAETRSADRLANFRYAAPEQRDRNATKDHRCDIYALGLMLNEMLTGEVPQGTEFRQIGEKHPSYSYLDELVAEMIRQQPDRRPSSIDAVRRRLKSSLTEPTARFNLTSSTDFFSNRFAKAFPGVRGIQAFDNFTESCQRLEILLQQPLEIEGKQPIWWWRSGEMPIRQMGRLSDDAILLDEHELGIQQIVAVNAGAYYQKFVYVQVLEGTPSGLYDYSYVSDSMEQTGFAREEFAIYDDRYVSRAEYDDGAAVIDGIAVEFESSPELRVRYLTPYNFLIAPVDSPLNNKNFDNTRDRLLNQILRGDAELEELIDAILELPKLVPPH